jgi:hypothetical protein
VRRHLLDHSAELIDSVPHNVCFTPETGMCSAQAHVCFGAIADMRGSGLPIFHRRLISEATQQRAKKRISRRDGVRLVNSLE